MEKAAVQMTLIWQKYLTLTNVVNIFMLTLLHHKFKKKQKQKHSHVYFK